mgnify:CR=1 FL=1
MKTLFLYGLVATLALGAVGCGGETQSAPAAGTTTGPARVQTQPTSSGKANAAVVVAGADGQAHVVAAAALGGLQVFGMDGAS